MSLQFIVQHNKMLLIEPSAESASGVIPVTRFPSAGTSPTSSKHAPPTTSSGHPSTAKRASRNTTDGIRALPTRGNYQFHVRIYKTIQ